MKLKTGLAAFICLFLISLCGRADPAEATEKYTPCIACHGDVGQGNAELGAPALAGQDAMYLQRQLAFFRDGIRGAEPRDEAGARMSPMAKALTDEDIALLASYLSELPAPPIGPAPEGNLKNGSNYYQAKCGACHGGQAQGNPGLNAPALAILDGAYLKRQVLNFQQGLRGVHPDDTYGRQMKMMSTSLPSDADLDDVIVFIQSVGAQQ